LGYKKSTPWGLGDIDLDCAKILRCSKSFEKTRNVVDPWAVFMPGDQGVYFLLNTPFAAILPQLLLLLRSRQLAPQPCSVNPNLAGLQGL
jgi:hypothetical protein